MTITGASPWSRTVRVTPADPLVPFSAIGAPAAVKAAVGNAQATVSWALPDALAQDAVTSFEIRSRLASASDWGPAKSAEPAARQTTITALVNGLPHVVGVRAITAAGPTPWSADVTFTPSPPALPLVVSQTDQPGVLRARWAPIRTATGYDLAYRAEADPTTVRRTVENGIPASTTESTFTVPEGSKYTVYLRPIANGTPGTWRQVSLVVPTFTLPVVRIGTGGEAPIESKDVYLPGTIGITPAPGSPASDAYAGDLEIKGRGNSTWPLPKKPYRVKLAKAAALLGLPKSKHWVLLANYVDKSQLRNAITFELGGRTVLPWTPRSRFVELVLNGRYVGLYQLVEQVRVDPGRIDIDPLKPADIAGDALTGGYHLERDGRWTPAEPEFGFRSTLFDEPFAIKDPEVPEPEQSAYIEGYVNAAESALRAPDFANPLTGYAKYLDVDSFVDWYIVNEYVRTVDGWWSSTNLFKPRLGTLHMGPLWDFDYSMGLRSGAAEQPAAGYWVRNRSDWYTRLFEDPAFVAKVRARWAVLRPSDAEFDALVDRQAAVVRTAIGFDQKVWGDTSDFSSEVAKIKSFMKARGAWFDRQWAD